MFELKRRAAELNFEQRAFGGPSNILAEYLERLLEAADELRHVAEHFVLVRETIAHFALQVIHERVGLRRGLLLEVLQELVGHVRALSQHVVQVAEAVFSRLLLVLDVSVHLLAFSVDVGYYLAFVGDSSLLLFNKAVGDAFDLCTDRVESIIMILDPVLLLLNERCLEFIPTMKTR